jgi:hypothetical protein
MEFIDAGNEKRIVFDTVQDSDHEMRLVEHVLRGIRELIAQLQSVREEKK